MGSHSITTTVHDGRLELRVPPEWPEGAEVEIRRLDQPAPADDGPMSTAEIARVLAVMDAALPFDLSDDERMAIDAERQARKEWELAHFDERAVRISHGWK